MFGLALSAPGIAFIGNKSLRDRAQCAPARSSSIPGKLLREASWEKRNECRGGTRIDGLASDALTRWRSWGRTFFGN